LIDFLIKDNLLFKNYKNYIWPLDNQGSRSRTSQKVPSNKLKKKKAKVHYKYASNAHVVVQSADYVAIHGLSNGVSFKLV
jgi:hypothetical protein